MITNNDDDNDDDDDDDDQINLISAGITFILPLY